MASLAVNAKVQGTVPVQGVGGRSTETKTDSNAAAVKRAELWAVAAFVALIVLHITTER